MSELVLLGLNFSFLCQIVSVQCDMNIFLGGVVIVVVVVVFVCVCVCVSYILHMPPLDTRNICSLVLCV